MVPVSAATRILLNTDSPYSFYTFPSTVRCRMIVSEFSSAQFMNSFSIWPEFHSLLDAVVQSMSPLDCRAVEACSPEWRITRLYLAVHWRSLKVSRRAVLVWPSVKVGGGGVMVCGCFSGLGSLVLLKGTLNASAYWDILDNFSSQLCGSSLGMAPSCTDMTARSNVHKYIILNPADCESNVKFISVWRQMSEYIWQCRYDPSYHESKGKNR